MAQRRFHFVASDSYRPRSNADIPSIGHLLKILKTNSKNVRSGQKQLLAEIHLLERVYYKGKNQHGLSLFWRSVVSARRMASRIYEVNIPRLLEILAGMFHEEAFTGTKVFSGAWTRIPPPENLAKILERSSRVVELLNSARETFLKAYRISVLASNLRDDLASVVTRVYAAFEALEPSVALHRRISKIFKKNSPVSSSPSMDDNTIIPQSAPTLETCVLDGEDLGFAIARTIQPPATSPLAVQANHSVSPPPIITPESPPVALDLPIALETVISPSPSPSPSQNALAPRSRENLPVEAEIVPIRSKIVPHNAGVTTKKGKKRRKVRDEIDDIFG
ncbi:hypothetical protein FRC07_005518 [Ceratobasidium sp. 392]|nr:hypothetical protein FRC07_005518 [Ceratobasidium sp. 392]